MIFVMKRLYFYKVKANFFKKKSDLKGICGCYLLG